MKAYKIKSGAIVFHDEDSDSELIIADTGEDGLAGVETIGTPWLTAADMIRVGVMLTSIGRSMRCELSPSAAIDRATAGQHMDTDQYGIGIANG